MKPPVAIVVVGTVEPLVEPCGFGIGNPRYFSGEQGLDNLLLALNSSDLETSVLGS